MKNYKEIEELLLETVGQANDYYIQKKVSAHEELVTVSLYYDKSYQKMQRLVN